MGSMSRMVLALIAAAMLAVLPAAAAVAAPRKAPKTRSVLYVGNNWDGTADVVEPRKFKRIARINIIPDIEERMKEIQCRPGALGYFLGIREPVGEGHDQFVDDMFSSHDGRVLYVSRPSLADVVAIDLRTKRIVWRTKVDGNRADHMAISPDGRQVLVSASTAKVVNVIDTKTGAIVADFQPATSRTRTTTPATASSIFHASIGTVFTPSDDPALDFDEGRALLPDHRREHLAGDPQDRHGREARRVRLAGHELGGAADGAVARRALRLLPGLVLPRLRRVRPAAGPGRCGWRTSR